MGPPDKPARSSTEGRGAPIPIPRERPTGIDLALLSLTLPAAAADPSGRSYAAPDFLDAIRPAARDGSRALGAVF